MVGLSQKRMALNKERIVSLLRSTGRDGIENLIKYLEKHDYFSAPASTKYHLSCMGGLAQHSLNVYENMMQLYYGENWKNNSKFSVCPDGTEHENIIMVALLHDLCKVDFYKLTNGRKKDDAGNWVDTQYYVVEEQIPILGHGTKSVVVAQQFIRLYVDEIQAISFHMGCQDADQVYSSTVSGVFEQSRFCLFTHLADLRATFVEDYDCVKWQDLPDTSEQVDPRDEAIDDDLPF